MGTDIPPPPPPDPPDPGDHCSICWGEGKPFGNGDTPSSFAVTISGIEKTGDWYPALGTPPDGTFKFVQDVSIPCFFAIDDGTYAGSIIQFLFNQTFVIITTETSSWCFIRTGSEICITGISNMGIFGFEGGTVSINLEDKG